MFYNFKNSKILVNGSGILANNAQIGVESNISPVYLAQQRHTTVFAPQDGIFGSLRLNYYLTGIDPLKVYLDNETSIISGNFGGLYFNSGYLKSYNLNSEPNNPVQVNADIIFFDALRGQFNPTYENVTKLDILNFADITLSDPTNGNIGTVSNAIGINFSFNSEVKPVYLADESIPSNVSFGVKEISTSIICDNLSGDLPVSGKTAGISISFHHPNIVGLAESFSCSGMLYKRDIQSNVGDIIKSTLQIKQNTVNATPTLASISPVSSVYNNIISISGTNLGTTNLITFNGNIAPVFTIVDASNIQVNVPYESNTGPIIVATNGGSVSSGNFTIIPFNMGVTGINKYTGYIGEEVSVLGTGFFRVTGVKFADINTDTFRAVSSGFITAKIPANAAWGAISVLSDLGVTGTSSFLFVPFPEITGFSPASGGVGQNVIIGGQAFSGITGVLFNNLTGAFTVDTNNQITATLPTGNTRGFIALRGRSGVSTLSDDEFFPLVTISGLSITSGRAGDIINISGNNFISALLYDNESNNKYVVGFGNGTGGFTIQTSVLLTGFVPSGATSGIVAAMTSDGHSFYPSTTTFKVNQDQPTIDILVPSSGISGSYLSLYGDNLSNIQNVRFSGQGVVSGASEIQEGQLGDIISFRVTGLSNLGLYSLIVDTDVGSVTGNNIFTLIATPVISGFTPTEGINGQLITVSGQNIYNFSRILIGAIETQLYTEGFSNNNTAQFYVPQTSLLSGQVIIDNTVGTSTGNYFTILNSPFFSGFNPLSGQFGDTILVSGSGLNLTTGAAIGEITVGNFTKIGTTGATFTVPETSFTDFVYLLTSGISSQSTGEFIVLSNAVGISGFTPMSVSYGDTLLVSGSRLDTTQAIYFSGSGETISLFDFSGLGTTGLRLIVPSDLINGQIKITNGYFTTQSSDILSIFVNPNISTLIHGSGKYNTDIKVSGANLAGMDFFFIGVTGNSIAPLQTTHVGSTGVTLRVPKEIIAAPITISGSGEIWGYSEQSFIPLASVSGFTPTGAVNTEFIRVTGINAYNAAPIVGITGSGIVFDLIDTSDSNSFSADYTRLTGSNVTDSTTGYSVFTLKIQSDFIGTGNIFLVPEAYNSYLSVQELTGAGILYISGILSSNQLSTFPGAPTITSFTPSRGNSPTQVTASGTNLSYVTGLHIINGATLSGITIDSQTANQIIFHPSTGYSAISGQIRATSAYGIGTSTNYFTFINAPIISGFTPTKGLEGAYILISGTGLDTLTGLFWGENEVSFDVISSTGISGFMPDIENPPQYHKFAGYNEAGSGESTGFFLIYESATILSYRSSETDLASIPNGSGTLTFTHGLGQIPDFADINLVCQIAESGYISGDEVQLRETNRPGMTGGAGSNTTAYTVSYDSSNIRMSYDFATVSGIYLAHKTSGKFYIIDDDRWKLRGIGYTSYYKLPLPATPQNLTLTVLDEDSIQLDWIFSSGIHCDGFDIERKSGSYSLIATVGSAIRQYIDSNLGENTEYTYRVRAFNNIF